MYVLCIIHVQDLVVCWLIFIDNGEINSIRCLVQVLA